MRILPVSFNRFNNRKVNFTSSPIEYKEPFVSYHLNGRVAEREFFDGSTEEYDEKGRLERQVFTDGTEKRYYGNHQLSYESFLNGTWRSYRPDGSKKMEEFKDGTFVKYSSLGPEKYILYPDGSEYEYLGKDNLIFEREGNTWRYRFLDETIAAEKLEDGTKKIYFKNGQIKYEFLPDGRMVSYLNGYPQEVDSIENSDNTVYLIKHPQLESPYWDSFTDKMANVYPDESIEEVLSKAVLKEENKIGEGARKKVYSIDGISDYVVAFYKERTPNENAKFKPSYDPYPEYNFGQEIGSNGANIAVMRKIPGHVHSILDWTNKYEGVVHRGETLTREDVKTFLGRLKEIIRCVPPSAYIEFAQQLKYLQDKGIKVDLFNPNNIMVSRRQINYFDLFEKPWLFQHLGPDLNGSQDMVCLLCDALMQGEYAKVMTEEEKQIMMARTRKIMERCEFAALEAGLTTDKSTAYRTYAYLQQRLIDVFGVNNKYLEQYKPFQEMYGIE